MPISRIGSNSLGSALTFVGQQTIPTINLTGGQITFPATAVPSTNANTLDDYEEGSWTPALNFGGGTTGITYLERRGSYIKIGKAVHVWCSIYLTNKGSSTGDSQITGLPFVGSNTFYDEQTASLSDVGAITFSGILTARVQFSTFTGSINAVSIFQSPSGGAQSPLTNTAWSNSTSVSFYSCYTAAS